MTRRTDSSLEQPFIVRAWPVDAAAQPVDSWYPKLAHAIDAARLMAGESSYRTVMVLDVDAMCWAQFNMLWAVPDGFA